MCSPRWMPAVVEAPQLGSLGARVPLAEVVAEGEDPLLGAGLLLVAAGATEGGVEAVSAIASSRVAVCSRLRDGSWPGSSRTRPWSIAVLDAGHDQLLAELGDPPVAELEHLGEVVAGVDVQQRERELRPAGRPSPPAAA